MNKFALTIILIIIVLIAGIGLSQLNTRPLDIVSRIALPTAAPEMSPEVSPVVAQTVTMDAGSFYYSVKEIRAKRGDRIRIIMTGKDMTHNLNIDELGVKSENITTGQTTTFEFVADKAGEFEYYCSIGQHRQNGQIGKLIVEE